MSIRLSLVDLGHGVLAGLVRLVLGTSLLAFTMVGCVTQKAFRNATAADEAHCRLVARTVTSQPGASTCALGDNACEAGHSLGSSIGYRNRVNDNYNDCMLARGLTEDGPEHESGAIRRPSQQVARAETWAPTAPSAARRHSCYAQARSEAKTKPELEQSYKRCLSASPAAEPPPKSTASSATRKLCLEEAETKFTSRSPKAEVRAFYRSCLENGPEKSRGDVGESPVLVTSMPDTALPAPSAAQSAERLESIDAVSLQGCLIVADDGEFLGLIESAHHPKSIMNKHGEHGSEHRMTSIFNRHGQYGGDYSRLSPFNPHTPTPPRIFKADGAFVGFLSRNRALTPSLDPHFLIGILRAAE